MDIKSWIENEPTVYQMPKQISIAVLAIMLFGIVAGIAIIFAQPEIQPRTDINELFTLDLTSFLSTLLMFVITEEIIFRLIPISIGMLVFNNIKFTIGLSLISSIIFGYLHGSFWNILLQGIIGFGFCLFYLKYGGYNKKVIKPFISVVLIHFLYNTILLLPIFLST